MSWKFPATVEGWMTELEGRKLAELAEGRVVLEIGSYQGLSTICMAQTALHVHSVDRHKGNITGREEPPTLNPMLVNLESWGLESQVTLHVGDCDDILPSFRSHYFGMTFIDGDHSKESVIRDANAALRVTQPGGVIAFHDWGEIKGHLSPFTILTRMEFHGEADTVAWFTLKEK